VSVGGGAGRKSRLIQAQFARAADDLGAVAAGIEPDLDRPLPRDVRALLPEAVERALSLGYDKFKAQVVPYLSEEDQTVYGTRDAWDRMRELVAERLEEFKS